MKQRKQMEIQFVTNSEGEKTAAIIPYEEWERIEKAKDILEHVYLSSIIEERKNSEYRGRPLKLKLLDMG
jgi:hypothetical protein